MMRYEWMLAMRYLRSRRDQRFVSLMGWSSCVGIAIGVAALLVVLSVMYGFDTELKDKILGFSPHVDIQSMGDDIQGWHEWLEKVEDLPGIKQAAPYISAQVMAVHGSRVSGALLKGVDVARGHAVAAHVIRGHFQALADAGSPFKVIMGKDLARKLGVTVGTRVNLVSPSSGITPSGITPRMRAFEVVGIFDSGFYEYDAGMMLTSLAAVQRLNRMGNRVTGIELRLQNRDKAHQMARVVRMQLPADAWVSDWMQLHRSFFRALRMERVVMGIILSLIVLVAVFNLVVSLVMVVMERQKEIAILKTVGATHTSVMRIFLYMGSLLAGVGTLLGTGFGLLLAWKLDMLLAWIERTTGVTFLSSDVYYIDHVPAIIDPVSTIIVVVVSFTMGVMAALYPAWRASHVLPAEVLRYE